MTLEVRVPSAETRYSAFPQQLRRQPFGSPARAAAPSVLRGSSAARHGGSDRFGCSRDGRCGRHPGIQPGYGPPPSPRHPSEEAAAEGEDAGDLVASLFGARRGHRPRRRAGRCMHGHGASAPWPAVDPRDRGRSTASWPGRRGWNAPRGQPMQRWTELSDCRDRRPRWMPHSRSGSRWR